MSIDPKIYPIGDCAAEGDEEVRVEQTLDTSDEQVAPEQGASLDDQWHESEEAAAAEAGTDAPSRNTAIICAVLALAWTGFYLWANIDFWVSGVTPQSATAMLSAWSGPPLILLVTYMLVSRRRRADARYFEQQVTGIAEASHLLDERLRTTNSELSMAREFINNQSTQLDSLGRSAIDRLTERAENVRDMIDGGDKSMQSIAEVSTIATNNLEELRKHMPVVTTSAKDMANQIGNAGRMAQGQIRDMINGFKKINEFGQASTTQVDALNERISRALTQWENHITALEISSTNTSQQLIDNSETAAQKLSEQQEAAQTGLDQFAQSFNSSLDEAASALQHNIDRYDEAIKAMSQQRQVEGDAIAAIIDTMGAKLEAIRSDIGTMDNDASQTTAQIAFAVSALNNEIASVAEALEKSHAATEQLTSQGEVLSQRTAALSSELGKDIQDKVATLSTTLERGEQHGLKSRQELEMVMQYGRDLEKLLENNMVALADQEQHVQRISGDFSDFIARNSDALQNADATLQTLSERMNSVSTESHAQLSSAFQDIRDNAEERLSEVEKRLEEVITALTATMGERSEAVLETAMRGKSEEVIGKLQLALNQALGATREASTSLVDQLGKVDALTANLESRVEHARERAEMHTDQEFTRNLALITESLNSASIDITKSLSNDVTDTAWAAYLKGDRGVFTRRAVRLLSAGEVREIASHYEQEPEFRETVNRYIHDFEAMLRDLLSTRNGEAFSVALLSSDIGKLYVALAQAIERFR
ncbi:hypothetical protein [Alterisphingorhabdus coralli]|uniref:ATPase n=1 Tax=Alterisphingorhabdus coralli TaxID=3071408 RepID=A0AA97F4L7_9SPHN|nr:hypothetical protein [Parasphingorhabdus sp. SCSIO 66989]WOE73936.1 hypothetical protein RB602_08670 [Parasphingorhabdus sp. SCSIO 66989]